MSPGCPRHSSNRVAAWTILGVDRREVNGAPLLNGRQTLRIHLQDQFSNLARFQVELQGQVWLGSAGLGDLRSNRQGNGEHDHPRRVVFERLLTRRERSSLPARRCTATVCGAHVRNSSLRAKSGWRARRGCAARSCRRAEHRRKAGVRGSACPVRSLRYAVAALRTGVCRLSSRDSTSSLGA